MGVVNYCIPDFATTLPILSYLKVRFSSLLFSNVKSPSVSDRELSKKFILKRAITRHLLNSINVLTLVENYIWFAGKISLNSRRQEKTRVHLLYNESTEINIFIFTATSSPCVFVFHAESIEIGRPYLETAIDFSYEILTFCWSSNGMFFPKIWTTHVLYWFLMQAAIFQCCLVVYMLRFGKLRQSVYEYEFDFFNEIRFSRP